MRPVDMEISVIEEVVVRRKRWWSKKKQGTHKAGPRAKDKIFSMDGSREKCFDVSVEPVEDIGTDLQIFSDDGANLDSEYKYFLDNIAVVENHLVLEYNVGEEDGQTRFVVYEGGDEAHEYRVTRNKKKKENRDAGNAKERTFGASKRPRSENEDICNSMIVPHIQKGEGNVRCGRKGLVSKKNVKLQPKNKVSCQRKSRSNRQPMVEELKLEACKRSDKYIEMEDYIYFLRYMMDAERISSNIHQHVTHRKCKEQPESSSDSDIVAIDDHPFSDGDNNPFITAKSYSVVDVDEEYGGSGRICNSWFRKELMEALRKPYSEKELYKLSCAASIQKPKIRVRELRDGRDISYQVNVLGKSYLHQTPDFRGLFMRQFGSTKFKNLLQLSLRDRHRALNLLRGFFLYIKNVVHEDAFRPWLDVECLKTMLSMIEEAPFSVAPMANGHPRRGRKARDGT